MIKRIYIKNFILIDKIDISPSDVFNVITGETGAGKSLLLKAMNLIFGSKNSVFLNKNDKKSIIELEIDISNYDIKSLFIEYDLDYSNNIILRREIQASRSRSFINDTPVNLQTLKLFSSKLIDIHAQFNNFLIMNPNVKLQILDSIIPNKNLFIEYDSIFIEYNKLKDEYENKMLKQQNYLSNYDYNRYILDEIEQQDIENIDLNKLESELSFLENSHNIKETLYSINNSLSAENSILYTLKEILSKFDKIISYSPNYHTLHDRLYNIYIEMKDISGEIETETDKLEINPKKIEELKMKLDKLFFLMKKHSIKDLEALSTIKKNIETEIKESENLDIRIHELDAEIKKLKSRLEDVAKQISNLRQKASHTLRKQIISHMQNLGIQNPIIQFKFTKVDLYKNGIDKIEILFSANQGFEPTPLEKCASGGEISRLMFILKYILSEAIKLPIIIFDEIDSGISGEISKKMSEMMQKMSLTHQIFVITHNPLIAAKGDKHFFIYKQENQDMTNSNIKELTKVERKIELAKMLGGDNYTQATEKAAVDMLSK